VIFPFVTPCNLTSGQHSEEEAACIFRVDGSRVL